MALTLNRFLQRPIGTVKQAQIIPVQSAHTASMLAQASRVPRLANINSVKNAIGNTRIGPVKAGARR